MISPYCKNAWFNFPWSKNDSLSFALDEIDASKWSVGPNHLWFTFPRTRKHTWKCWAPGGTDGRPRFRGTGGCPVLALLAPPRFEPQARLSARALPPARSCSRFGCSGFPRRGGGAGSARSDSGSGFCTNAERPRAAPGGRPSSPAPRSTVMAREEGRARSAAAPAPPPLRCPARPLS